jgi:hypothetical protein
LTHFGILKLMKVRVVRLLIVSYMGLVVSIAGGFMLYPDLFFDYPHRGLSYYGNYFPTVVPYALGLMVSIVGFLLAAYFMPRAPRRVARLRYLLIAIAGGLVGVLLTPEQANPLFYWAHMYATITLFAIAGGTALWIMTYGGVRWIDRLLFGIMLAGGGLSLLSAPYIGVLGFLPLGQVLAVNSATLIIIRGCSRWLPDGPPERVPDEVIE